MTQRAYVRSILTQLAAAAIVVIVLGLFGPIAALAVALIGGALACLIVVSLHRLGRVLDEIDDRCGEIDNALNQERAAREALRTQHTVQAQVIVFPQRRRTDGAA